MGQVLWTLCGDVGYVMTYGAFGTDPPTPFGVGGLNSIALALVHYRQVSICSQ